MKRTKRVSASDGRTRVRVTIEVVSDGYLMRHEVDKLTAAATDAVMQSLPLLPLSDFRLSDTRVH